MGILYDCNGRDSFLNHYVFGLARHCRAQKREKEPRSPGYLNVNRNTDPICVHVVEWQQSRLGITSDYCDGHHVDRDACSVYRCRACHKGSYHTASSMVYQKLHTDVLLLPEVCATSCTLSQYSHFLLSIFWNGVAVELQLSQIFQTVFGWSTLNTGIRFIPIGAHVMPFTTSLRSVDV